MVTMEVYKDAMSGFQGIFNLFMYGFIGTMASFIITYSNMDMMQDRLQMTFNDAQDTFEFIIVGGGSAGCALASRLSEDYKVLLLEAGGEYNPLTLIPSLSVFMLNRPYVDWQFYTAKQQKACLGMTNHMCAQPRGLGLGGSSNLNFLIYMRGSPYDFENWANETGDYRWKYQNVVQYFKKSESYSGEFYNDIYHAKDGPLKVSKPSYKGIEEIFCDAGIEKGYPRTDLNAAFTQGFSPIFYTEYQGRRFSTYRAFVEPIRDRSNLKIYKYAHVNKVFIDESNRAYAVEYIRHGEKKVAFASKEIILSAGSINSPKILLHSGVGPKEQLQSFKIPLRMDLPVGKNLMDHISAFIGPFIINETLSMMLDRDINPSTIQEYLNYGTGPVSSSGIQASAFLVSERAKAEGQGNWADIQYLLLGTGIHDKMANDFTRAFNMRPGIMDEFYDPLSGIDSFQIVNMLSRPKGRGEVRLKSRDPLVPAVFDPKYLEIESDMKVMLEGTKRALDLVENTEAFQKISATLSPIPFPPCKHLTFRSEKYWECYIRHFSLTIFHPSGTCRMGRKDDPRSVVDSELRVLGIEGLRVIDASIMPYITTGNTNAPTIMIAEMGADLIKGFWGGKTNEIKK